ncbi:MAG: hypothetical protein Q7K03_05445 [Dehalococcoidia bacterium]|nr:hypothetical protein [Dehalococcoidia bacterium]
MAELHQGHEERQPFGAVSPWLAKAGGKRWFLGGAIVGLLLWVAVFPFLGDPRISDVITPLDGAGPPVLVSRTQFRVVAEAPVETLAQAPKPGILPSTKAQLETVQPVMWAMALPEVREALGYSEKPMTVAPAPTPEAQPTHVPGPSGQATQGPTPATQPAQAEPQFSYPEHMVPGSPAASLAQVMNPTKNIILAEFRPTVTAGQDSRLCSALRTAIVSVEAGKAPKVVAKGKLVDMIDGRAAPMVLEPGVRYNLAILVSVPQDAGNEYQGVSCSVDFMMQAQGI